MKLNFTRQPNSFYGQFYLQILPHYCSDICRSQNYTCNAQFHRKKKSFFHKKSFKYKIVGNFLTLLPL